MFTSTCKKNLQRDIGNETNLMIKIQMAGVEVRVQGAVARQSGELYKLESTEEWK